MAISVCLQRASARGGSAAAGPRRLPRERRAWTRAAAVVYGGLCVFEQVARISAAVNTERWIKPLLTLSSVCSLELIILPFPSHTRVWRGKVCLGDGKRSQTNPHVEWWSFLFSKVVQTTVLLPPMFSNNTLKLTFHGSLLALKVKLFLKLDEYFNPLTPKHVFGI